MANIGPSGLAATLHTKLDVYTKLSQENRARIKLLSRKTVREVAYRRDSDRATTRGTAKLSYAAIDRITISC